MQKAGWIYFAALLAFQMHSSFSDFVDTSRWQSIDCGIDDSRLDGLIVWDTDFAYTQTGSNKIVRDKTSREEFNTLRAFNTTHDNCYTVPTETQTIRYIIRVGFYYGNYDGLSKPPTFNLFINNAKWSTVNTSINNGEPFYEEIIYENKASGFLKICLVKVKDGGIPFISSIETVVVFDELYPKMETNATYNLVTRTNLGGPEIRYGEPDYSADIYNRIWSKDASPYAKVTGFPNFKTYENQPPVSVLGDGVESNASIPINFIVDLPANLTSQSAYIVFYITELDFKEPNKTRIIKIEIDGQDQGTVESLNYGNTTVVTKYPVIVSGPSIDITLSSGEGSSLPPTISALEVFTKWDSDHHKSAAAQKCISLTYLMIFVLHILMLKQ